MSLGALTRTVRLAAVVFFALAFPAAADAVVPGMNGALVYRAYENLDLINPDGSRMRSFPGLHDVRAFDPSWSPDGERLAFTGNGVEVIDADGGSRTVLFPNYWDPAWSPDGTKISASGGPGLAIFDSDDGSNVVYLPTDDAYASAWSPDGTTIAYTDGRTDAGTIYVINVNGTGNTALRSGAHPAWSPDGSKIAFDYHGQIYTMNPDGSGVKRLTSGSKGGDGPAWSPDGTQIAYSRRNTIGFIRPNGTRFREFRHIFDHGLSEIDWQVRSVGLSPVKPIVDYGRAGHMTVRILAGTTNPDVSLYKVSRTGARRLVGSSPVDASGKRTFTVRLSHRMTYVATWAGAVGYPASESVTLSLAVRPIVRTLLRGHHGRSGGYHLFRLGGAILVVGHVSPNQKGRRLVFEAERKRRGRWRGVVQKSFRIGRFSLAGAFFYTNAPGVYRFRTRTEYHSDLDVGTSKWRLAKVT